MKKILFTTSFLINTLLVFSQCFDNANVYSFDYNGHSYKIVKENKNWEDASNCAVLEGGYLTEIGDLAEQNTVFLEVTNNANITTSTTVNQFGTAAVWIGGSDSQTEGVWIWDGNNDGNGTQFWDGGTNGTPVGGAYTNWGTSPQEPDNSGNQDKLTLTIASSHPNFGKWNDLESDNFNEIYYIIEYDQLLSVTEESSLKNEVKVYPNPFKNVIYVENNSLLHVSKIELSNNIGQVVYAEKTTSKIEKIMLPDLEKGIYYLSVYFENGNRITYKITQ